MQSVVLILKVDCSDHWVARTQHLLLQSTLPASSTHSLTRLASVAGNRSTLQPRATAALCFSQSALTPATVWCRPRPSISILSRPVENEPTAQTLRKRTGRT